MKYLKRAILSTLWYNHFICKCQYKIDKKIQNKIDKKIQYKLCEISNICFDISLCFYNLKNASSFI